MALDEFIRDLEVYLYERNYEQFTHLMLEYKRKETQGIESATEAQQAKVSTHDVARALFVFNCLKVVKISLNLTLLRSTDR